MAALILDAERDAAQVEKYLLEIRRRYLPPDAPHNVFHAKDLFHGSGYFERAKWPKLVRHQILRALMYCPIALNLCVAFGVWWKDHVLADPAGVGYNDDEWAHALPFVCCLIACDEHLRDHALPNEVGYAVAENNHATRTACQKIARLFYSDAPADKLQSIKNALPEFGIPIRRIIRPVHFADKEDCAPLQIADAYAFTQRRILCNNEAGFDAPFQATNHAGEFKKGSIWKASVSFKEEGLQGKGFNIEPVKIKET